MNFLEKYKQQEEARLARAMLAPVEFKSRKFLILGLTMVAVLSSATAIYFWQRSGSNNPNVSVNKNSSDQILADLGKLMVLPDNEQPTIATVSNPEFLKSVPFFDKAKIGDKVIIYVKSKEAILYDPIVKKVVQIAPLNLK